MKLFLLRHADADTEAATDAERHLSGKGEDQARRVGEFCKRHGFVPDAILTSPLRRTRQTARAVAVALGREVEVVPWLSCGATPEGTLRQLTARKFSSVMLVGHEPDTSALAGFLMGAEGIGVIHVRKASLTLLEVVALLQGGGRLEFSIPVRLMGPGGE